MKRLFLVILVMTLILVSAAVQGAANAFPGGEEEFLGLIPMWDLRVAIPCGVFAAGELVVAMGLGVQMWLGIRRVAGKGEPETDRLMQQLVLCSLWCGWTLIACCTTGLVYIIPGIGTPLAYSLGFYGNFTLAGAVLTLICYALNVYLPGRAGVIPAVLAAGLAVAAGWLWHGNYFAVLLLACLMGVAGYSVRLCVAQWPEGRRRILSAVAGLVPAIAYVLYLVVENGRELDAGLVTTFGLTLVLAAALSVLRLIR